MYIMTILRRGDLLCWLRCRVGSRFLSFSLGFVVQGGGGFVKEEDFGGFEEDAGNADSLFLSA